MKTKYLKVMVAVTAVVLCSGFSAFAAEMADMKRVSGEIAWVDVKAGKLQLEKDAAPRSGEITEYRITPNGTRITNPKDDKFLLLGDLQPGQHVTLEVMGGKEDAIVEKITVDPKQAAVFQEAYGAVTAIDGLAGRLSIAGRPVAGEAEGSNVSHFVFDPKTIIAMQSPSSTPVLLEVKPGDIVKVEYVLKDDKQQAHSVTLYAPKVTRTTTTTTVTTTQ